VTSLGLDQLGARLPALMLRDEQRLRRRLDQARSTKDPALRERQAVAVADEIVRAEARIARRRTSVPVLRYPQELPVSQARAELTAAIAEHQVVVVAGETGSGKTTQLPKICLELGRGVRGLIGHTQPRRLAARTIAARIFDELGTPLGATVGWKVRFTDDVSDDTLVKLMTDGVLLARAQPERRLPARLPRRNPSSPAGPQGRHHLGHDRPGTLRRSLHRDPGPPGAGGRGVRAYVPGGGSLPTGDRSG